MVQVMIIESVGYVREGAYVQVLAYPRGPFHSLAAAIEEAKRTLLKEAIWHGLEIKPLDPAIVNRAVADLATQKAARIEKARYAFSIEIKECERGI